MSTANSDDGAEMDTFRDALGELDTVITHDTKNSPEAGGPVIVEYICGMGDPPFVKYRLTLESISEHSVEEFEQAKATHQQEAAE